MKQSGGSDEAKRRAGEAAADRVIDGQVVGLGTGSTAAYAIRALGRAVDSGLDIYGVPTSLGAHEVARKAGVPVTTLADAAPDIAIDGADAVAASERGFDLLKGGGAAHTREKYVDWAADELVVVADPTKLTETLSRPVPVEVLPDARPVVASAVREAGGDATLRPAERKDGPLVTDNGNLVLDCAFGPIQDPPGLAADLSAIPGVVDHGLFVGIADSVILGHDDGVEIREAERHDASE